MLSKRRVRNDTKKSYVGKDICSCSSGYGILMYGVEIAVINHGDLKPVLGTGWDEQSRLFTGSIEESCTFHAT